MLLACSAHHPSIAFEVRDLAHSEPAVPSVYLPHPPPMPRLSASVPSLVLGCGIIVGRALFLQSEVGCLAKCPIPTQGARLGGPVSGRAHAGLGGTSLPKSQARIGARSVELCTRVPMIPDGRATEARGTVSVGRRHPRSTLTHPLTHPLTQRIWLRAV